VVKGKFHYFWALVEHLLEKSTNAPPGKIPPDAHAHKHVKQGCPTRGPHAAPDVVLSGPRCSKFVNKL